VRRGPGRRDRHGLEPGREGVVGLTICLRCHGPDRTVCLEGRCTHGLPHKIFSSAGPCWNWDVSKCRVPVYCSYVNRARILRWFRVSQDQKQVNDGRFGRRNQFTLHDKQRLHNQNSSPRSNPRRYECAHLILGPLGRA
jgi:hypothetical protein